MKNRFIRGLGRRFDRGQGPGSLGGPKSAGPGGNCVCPNCGHHSAHRLGQSCNQIECPKCGSKMSRE